MKTIDRELFIEWKKELVRSNRKNGGTMVEDGFAVTTKNMMLWYETCCDPTDVGRKLAEKENGK